MDYTFLNNTPVSLLNLFNLLFKYFLAREIPSIILQETITAIDLFRTAIDRIKQNLRHDDGDHIYYLF